MMRLANSAFLEMSAVPRVLSTRFYPESSSYSVPVDRPTNVWSMALFTRTAESGAPEKTTCESPFHKPMSFKLRRFFDLQTAKRYATIMLWLTRHLGLLLSASVEVYLRHNLGRRYMFIVFSSFVLCFVYTAVVGEQSFFVR